MSEEPKVTHLREAPRPAQPESVVPDIPAILAFLLREAEAGRLHAIAISAIRDNEDGISISSTMFAGVGESPVILDRLIGSVATLQHRLVVQQLDAFAVSPADAPRSPA